MKFSIWTTEGLYIQTSGRVVSGFAISVNELPGKMTKGGKGLRIFCRLSNVFGKALPPSLRISADFQC